MATAKSPFKIYRNFLSPKLCQQFCDQIGFTESDLDSITKKPKKMVKFNEGLQLAIYARIQMLIHNLEKYYEFEYSGTEQIMVEWYSEGVVGTPICDNSNYVEKKWIRTRERDFTGIVFLSQYCDQPNFDSDYEVYGGKLEFPQHAFGFNPEIGTLILFPSAPHFINANAEIQAGELYQARFYIAAKTPYLYNPSKFPGDWRSWFNGL